MRRRQTSRVRLVDIAERAGVSAMLVSAVLSGRSNSAGTVRASIRTEQRVRRLASEMGYRPNAAAQQLRGKRTKAIGVLIGAESTPANFERLAAIEREAQRRGWRLMIGEFRGQPGQIVPYIEDFSDRGIEAIICFHNPLPWFDPQTMQALAGIRAVVFQTYSPLPNAYCVDVDRADGVRQAIQHLLERGRRRVGLVLNSPAADDALMDDRRRGYLAGLQGAGQTAERIWCGDGTYPPTRRLADDALDALVERAGADAVIASNDVWAIELIKAARRRRLSVPQDLAVVGFDNLQAAELFDPALTSIDQNNPAFAAAAVDLLHEALASNRPGPRKLVVKPRLVIREST